MNCSTRNRRGFVRSRRKGVLLLLISLFMMGCMDELPDYRGPFLSWTDSPRTTMTVTWESLRDGLTVIRWGTSANDMANVVTLKSPKRRDDMYYHYSTTIPGLTPDTQYYYQVDALQDAPVMFRTAPGESGTSWSFLLYGDSCETDKTKRNEHYDVVRQMVAEHNGSEVAFVISSGDLTVDDPDIYGWDLHFDAIRPLAERLPYFTPFGNHDWNISNVASHYLSALWIHEFPRKNRPDNEVRAFDETSYGFAYGDAYFVFIGFDRIGAPPDDAFTVWLDDVLSYAYEHYSYTFVDMHRPPFDRRSDGYADDMGMLNFQAPLFHKYAVTAVFSGHNHVFAHHEIEKQVLGNETPVSVTYLVSGGGGQDLRTAYYGTWQNRHQLGYVGETVFTRSVNHFVRVDINESEGTATFTAVSNDGDVIYGPLVKHARGGHV